MLNVKYKTGAHGHNDESDFDSDWASTEGFMKEGPF